MLALAALIAAGCNSYSSTLPGSDGYGPLGGGTSPSPGGTASTGAPAPTNTATPPPPLASADAGAPWEAGAPSGWSDAGWSGTDAGESYDAWPAPEAGGDDAGSVPSALLSVCIGEINEVRDQNGAFLLAESADLEAFAASAAASDAASGQRHGYFDQQRGDGVSDAEVEFDGDSVEPGGTAQQVLQQGLLDAEDGFGGFDDLVTNEFSQAGCGFAQDSTGSWWVTIELR
jgi:Cysteine-rich secretory protein family